MHLVSGGEDVVDVGEDVVHREEDGFTSATKHFTEEHVGIQRVGEGHREQLEGVGAVTNLVEVKHHR